jgi:hypothetical protein
MAAGEDAGAVRGDRRGGESGEAVGGRVVVAVDREFQRLELLR